MKAPDSQTDPARPGAHASENRDDSRETPVYANGIGAAAPDPAPAIAGAALKAAGDAFQIHASRFDEIRRGPSAVSKARQAAIEAAVELAGLSPWRAALAFGVDLSTAKNAVRRAKAHAAGDADFAARRAVLRGAFQTWIEGGAS